MNQAEMVTVKDEVDTLKDEQGEVDALKDQRGVTETQVTTSGCQRLSTLVSGWRTYARQSVVFAGLSLAMLYMTVLGFDSITVGESVSLCHSQQ